jgi:Fe-S cluster assembly ATP-binding protein
VSSVLRIEGLRASVAGKAILRGVDLEITSGQVHAVMGPNGSGKSTLAHVLMGRPGYEVTGGSATIDGRELLGLPTWERAQAGLFLALQYPIEVPGVALVEALEEAAEAGHRDRSQIAAELRLEAQRLGQPESMLSRSLNADMSGGEKKLNETVQLAVLRPLFAVLDEIDSGLDVDALRVVSARVEAATEEQGLGVLAITHYSRLLNELRPDVIHVLVGGRIVERGGPELAAQLEETGYAAYGPSLRPEPAHPEVGDPLADPLA